jgi:NAD(P)-dependent dehydrogenase (short-subunit alcohol dehydrogenase family)
MAESPPTPIALVTGASRGIGAAVAAGLIRAGSRVVLTARRESDLRALSQGLDGPGEFALVAGDLREPATPGRLLAEAGRRFGPPQILVTCAGTAPTARFLETDESQLQETLDLNLWAPFRLLRGAMPRMEHRSVAVLLASTAGLVGFPFTTAYCAAKHGMVGLARSLAAELGSSHPRIYALCPGFVDTDLTRRAARAVAARGRHRFP